MAVATRRRGGRSKPSSAAARMPPWLPTSPPKTPESTPPVSRQNGVRGNGTRRRSSSVVPARTSSVPKTRVRMVLASWVCRAAPTRPPTALATPNCRNVGRSTSARSRSHRIAVASAWGIDRTATASAAGIHSIKTGVSRLPMPKPDTDATAPASTEAAASSHDDSTLRRIPRNARAAPASAPPPARRASGRPCTRLNRAPGRVWERRRRVPVHRDPCASARRCNACR